jgi:alpha-beta hydrolase superfamily lysophospholipase
LKTSRKRLGRWKILLIVLTVLTTLSAGGAYWLVVNVASYAILIPNRKTTVETPADLGFAAEALTLRSDSVVLRGYYYTPAAGDTLRGALILVHGLGDYKESFIERAAYLAQAGFAVYSFDNRAHGASGGTFTTYGFHEKHDVARIVDRARADHPGVPVGIWGNSLGGAIGLQALAYDERLAFGVIESTFRDLREIVYDYMEPRFGFQNQYISDLAVAAAGEIARFEPDSVRPIAAVREIEQPVLIVHGAADRNISVAYGRDLYRQLVSTDKELLIVPNAGHVNVSAVYGPDYLPRVLDFVDRALSTLTFTR